MQATTKQIKVAVYYGHGYDCSVNYRDPFSMPPAGKFVCVAKGSIWDEQRADAKRQFREKFGGNLAQSVRWCEAE